MDPIWRLVHLGRRRHDVHQRPPVSHPAARGAGRRVEPSHQVSRDEPQVSSRNLGPALWLSSVEEDAPPGNGRWFWSVGTTPQTV